MILVTGCAGFIGSNLCHYFIGQGEVVLGIDALRIGSSLRNIQSLDMQFMCLDLANAEQVNNYFKTNPGIKYVVHLAAESHVDRSIKDDSHFWRSNVIGTANLLRAVSKTPTVIKTIVQITDEAYGEKPVGEALEGDKFNPTSPYPCSKVAQYYAGRSFYTTYGTPIVFTFPVNCYGPRQWPEKLIPKFTSNLMNDLKVPLMASTHFERDWLPVEDMCRALSLLLEKGVPGEDYNVGANNHHSNLELTRKLISLCSKDESYIEIVADRKAHDCRYAVNADKIKSLGWSVENDFDNYLEYTVDWYRRQIQHGLL